MKIPTLTVLLVFLKLTLFGQSDDTWTAFWNRDTTLIGYKNKNGVVKIEPKFQPAFTSANRFDNIIAVAEETNQHWQFYYLTKSGRIVGKDSLHIFDNNSDCESEGFIRFTDKKTGKVGMFNRNGDIVIPAVYNAMTSVRNGLIIALTGAEKKNWKGGEHYNWIGGEKKLIDTANNIVIDNFQYTGNINFFSLLISAHPNPDMIRQNFKTGDGNFLSFIDFDKEFKSWLKNSLLNNVTKENLLNATYKEITYWKELTGWTSESKNSFIDRNYELIRTKLLQLNVPGCDYTFSSQGLNPLIYSSDEYRKFFNNCGESKEWIYPIEDILISYKEDKCVLQDHLEFLRTDDGYKLISLTIRNGEIK